TTPNVDRIAVANISSLLAVMPFANWGLYASIKAARDQLLKVVALEHRDDPRVRTLSYAPGPLDNDMQAEVRASIGDAEQKQAYSDMHSQKKLVKTDDTAGLLCNLLEEWTFESGAHIDIYDIIDETRSAFEMDLDQTRLRKRQVEVLTRALGQFVSLKSSAEGWVPVAPGAGRWTPHTGSGGDVSVQMGKRTVADGNNKQTDIYRMTASIPLDPG
ncbi:hypothetical protein GGF42_009346, partial [Coemansia sp. RSA 2424]